MYYSHNNNYPVLFSQIPERIRLSNGLTRTDKSTFTEQELLDAGYKKIDTVPPQVNSQTEKVTWTGTDWSTQQLTAEEIAQLKEEKWSLIRKSRDVMIDQTIWRIQRCESEIRLGITTTDSMVVLDTYVQALRDITKQPDPFNVEWPILA
jgi:hypothetical protein